MIQRRLHSSGNHSFSSLKTVIGLVVVLDKVVCVCVLKTCSSTVVHIGMADLMVSNMRLGFKPKHYIL